MLVLISHAALAFSLLAQQEAPAARTAVSRTDSIRIGRSARNAQSSFEAFRRNRLPTSWSGGGSGFCEMRIGRYCYWRGDEAEDDTPPVELPAIRERRAELVQTLDSAAHQLPADEWIAGERVRYLVESDRIDDALQAAGRECRAAASWCNALAGYAAHVGGRFAAADSAYELALAAMDPPERCRWFDISDLLSDELQHRFRGLDCSGRETFARQLFWLGSPLYSMASTDLLTEHFARLTRVRMSEHAASSDGESWGDDMRELVLRYGWPRWYSRSAPTFGWEDRPSITGHDAGVPYDFLPSIHAVDSVGHAKVDDWQLDDPRAQNGYAPAYARTIHVLAHQLAVFRRGDSVRVVAAWDARADTTLLGRRLNAALVVSADATHTSQSRVAGAPASGHLSVVAPIDSGIASIEVLAPDDRRAGRARIGIPRRATGGITVSDLLLYRPGDSPPTSLDAATSDALSDDVVGGARSLGVFWEAYGLGAEPGAVDFALSVERIDVDWLHRAAAALHLADPAAELHVRWQEVPQLWNGIAARGVSLNLSRLRAGRYRVELTVGHAGDAAVARREIQVQ